MKENVPKVDKRPAAFEVWAALLLLLLFVTEPSPLEASSVSTAFTNGMLVPEARASAPKLADALDILFLQNTITGSVVNEAGQPIPGVSVLVKGTTVGTTTEAEGNYAVDVPNGSSVLIFSFIGYESQEVAIGNRTVIDIILLEDVKSLDEVVTIGYGEQSRETVTTSISKLDEGVLENVPYSNVASAMQGTLPGVVVQSISGQPGAAPFVLTACDLHSAKGQDEGSNVEKVVDVDERYIAIDNVTAWPNLTVLPDGTFIATIFNKANYGGHGSLEGNAEAWWSKDGRFWEKRGTPVPNEPGTNRMNLAAGLAGNGDLIVLVSGWQLKKPTKPGEGYNGPDYQLPVAVSRSSDGGYTWSIEKEPFPAAEPGMTNLSPFGDIFYGADGSLRVSAASQFKDRRDHKGRPYHRVYMLRSDDDGHSWKVMSMISERHTETFLFHVGNGKWLAVARQSELGRKLDLFRSEDDGKTWQFAGPLTDYQRHPGHLLRLDNGDLLLTYGNRRSSGPRGVAGKISKDEGRSWSEEFFVINDLKGDVGYPASAQLENGKILTIYYSRWVAAHQRYHMGSVFWNLPDDL